MQLPPPPPLVKGIYQYVKRWDQSVNKLIVKHAFTLQSAQTSSGLLIKNSEPSHGVSQAAKYFVFGVR